MKRIVTTALAVSFITVAFSQNLQKKAPSSADEQRKQEQVLEIGNGLPDQEFPMKDVSGKDIKLAEMNKENGLLVMFSCNTCPYVIKSQARTKEMATLAEELQIGMVIINSNEGQREEQDSYEAMQEYAKEQGYKVPYVLDEGAKLADLFGANRTPEVFLFNAEGKLIYHGAMEDNPAAPSDSKELYLKNAMEKINTGELPDPSFTKSVGCTIKRAK